MDNSVQISCGECDFNTESLNTLINHILEFHPNYTFDEALYYAELWQENAYEKQELADIERAGQFRLRKHYPED